MDDEVEKGEILILCFFLFTRSFDRSELITFSEGCIIIFTMIGCRVGNTLEDIITFRFIDIKAEILGAYNVSNIITNITRLSDRLIY